MVHTLLVTSVALAAWRLFPATAIVEFSASVGLNSMSSVPAKIKRQSWSGSPSLRLQS